jgi:hypothetical protein
MARNCQETKEKIMAGKFSPKKTPIIFIAFAQLKTVFIITAKDSANKIYYLIFNASQGV